MVAITPNQLFPYPEGTDRPCESHLTWCEFVNLLDPQLLAIDNTLARLSPAIPAAKLVRTVDFTAATPTGASIPYETVEFDTDDMADLSRSVFQILPRRTGSYMLVASAEISEGSTVAAVPLALVITKGSVEIDSSTASFTITGQDVQRATGDSTSIWLRVGVTVQWTPADASVNEGGFGTLLSVGNENGIVHRAEFSMYWQNDRYQN